MIFIFSGNPVTVPIQLTTESPPGAIDSVVIFNMGPLGTENYALILFGT